MKWRYEFVSSKVSMLSMWFVILLEDEVWWGGAGQHTSWHDDTHAVKHSIVSSIVTASVVSSLVTARREMASDSRLDRDYLGASRMCALLDFKAIR